MLRQMLRATAGWGRAGGTPITLQQAITNASLTTNLNLCLDAGDIVSYPGTGTKWLDTSGNGYDFLLGSDGTTNAPKFVGLPGEINSYWQTSAAQYFTYDSVNET